MTTLDTTPIPESERAPIEAPSVKIIVPAPEPIKWPKKKSDGKPFKLSLPPPKVWEYRLSDGSLYGAVGRWDRADGKIVLPCVYGEVDGTAAWRWSGFGDADGCRPLLGLVELSTNPLATVLIVEGEKARDAAPRHMPPGWIAMTWQGGGKAIAKTDWSPLSGRRVVIWPDKDAPPVDPKTGQVRIDAKTGRAMLPPGEQTAVELYILLTNVGAGVAQVPVYGPSLRMIPNDGWDLADPAPEGFNPTEWMEKAAGAITMPQARLPSPSVNGHDNAPPAYDGGEGRGEDTQAGSDATAEYRALGYSQENGTPMFHFFAARSGFIVSLSMEQACKRTGIYNICHNDGFWREHFDFPRDKFEKLPWTHIGTRLVEACYKAGYFKVDNERGRGAWLDNGRVVMHLGQTLLVDNKPMNPAKMVSEYFYPVRQNFFKLKDSPALSDDEGKHLRKVCRFLNWENPFYAELLGGWIATAIICGAMAWRTHFWLTGPSMVGKSWIANNIVGMCFGKLGYYPLGNSSAAGILGSLGRDARPVVFDEAEGRGELGIKRREMIIEMMRYSSTETQGEVVKGTAGHGVVAFRVQSQYFLSSIGVGITETADLSRTVVCGLRARGAMDSFEQLKGMVKQFPKDLPERLLRRQLKNLNTIKANAETLAHVIALQNGNRRIGDMLGTLMAGDHSLVSDSILTFEQAEERVNDRMQQKKFDDFNRIRETQEDVDLFQHIASYTVRPQNSYGVGIDMTLGELMAVGLDLVEHDRMPREMALAALKRIGLALEMREGVPGFWIARAKTTFVTGVMSKSTYPVGWERILLRHPKAVDSGKEQKNFNGFKQRAIWLPYAVLISEEVSPLMPEVDAAE
jgi:putative DNA primase/helicase